MDNRQVARALWDTMNKHEWNDLLNYFSKDAVINWHNTNEKFTIEDFITANSTYPGNWHIEIERIEQIGDKVITVVCVVIEDEDISFHATSFFTFDEKKIIQLDEYWGVDGEPPEWRIDMRLGRFIKKK